MNQKTALKILKRQFKNQTAPVTPEGIVAYLIDQDGLDMKDPQIGKIRDYVKSYILNKVSHRIAGGVIYPKQDIRTSLNSVKYKDVKGGASDLFIKLIKKTLARGKKFGDRVILPNVSVRGMDMRLGHLHYHAVGYKSFNITRVWNKYFKDADIRTFADGLDFRTGYSNIYRCALDSGHVPCIDSISVIFTSKESALVHVNFRISNLNRMNLMDYHLIHRFIRLVFPLEMLPNIEISCHFNTISLDTSMLGWLVNIPEFDEIRDTYRTNKYENFKRMTLPRDFEKIKTVKDVGINMFLNNHYGIEELYEREYNPRLTLHKWS